MDPCTQKRLQRKQGRRKLLRALNGAALGAVLGGLVGALLGFGWGILFAPHRVDIVYALFGALPGMFGGFWIGLTTLIRDDEQGMAIGVMTGGAVGALYALPMGALGGSLLATCSLISGIAGGFILSFLIRWIRARWSWWTRWEE